MIFAFLKYLPREKLRRPVDYPPQIWQYKWWKIAPRFFTYWRNLPWARFRCWAPLCRYINSCRNCWRRLCTRLWRRIVCGNQQITAGKTRRQYNFFIAMISKTLPIKRLNKQKTVMLKNPAVQKEAQLILKLVFTYKCEYFLVFSTASTQTFDNWQKKNHTNSAKKITLTAETSRGTTNTMRKEKYQAIKTAIVTKTCCFLQLPYWCRRYSVKRKTKITSNIKGASVELILWN